MMADLIGYFALGITVFALVRKESDRILLLISIGVLLWGVHYWLLGSFSGAIIHFIAGAGIFIAHATMEARLGIRIALAGIFIVLGCTGSLYSEVTAANLLAAIGGAVMTVSQYVLRGQQMRQGFIVGEAIIFGFAFLVGSVPGMLVTLTNVGAGLIGLWRLRQDSGKRGALAVGPEAGDIL